MIEHYTVTKDADRRERELAGETDQLQDNQILIPGQRRTRRTERGEDWR